MNRKRVSKAEEIRALLTDVFGPPAGWDYEYVAQRLSEWDFGSPRGVLNALRGYQEQGKLPYPSDRPPALGTCARSAEPHTLAACLAAEHERMEGDAI